MKIFTILGTGWLGLELAKSLQKQYKIKVSSRNKDKLSFYKELGFEAYVLNEQNLENLNDLLKCDYLFINFPPSKFDDYLGFLGTIYSNSNIKTIKKIFFVSSTSVYPKEDGIYDENFQIKEASSSKVFEAEMQIKDKTDVIFRCSGLIGGHRIAGKRLSNKEVKDSHSLVNHIHRTDIIRATNFVIEKDLNGVFNLSAPINPSKKEIYEKNSLKFDFKTPIFKDEFRKNRIINGKKICSYGFKYKFENPLDFS